MDSDFGTYINVLSSKLGKKSNHDPQIQGLTQKHIA